MPPSPFPEQYQHPGGIGAEDMRFPRSVNMAGLSRAARTRMGLMQATAFEIYENGYQAASLSDILARAGATKGALYHHFADKRSLALASMRHFFESDLHDVWIAPFENTDDPITTLKAIIGFAHSCGAMEDGLKHGCPLVNLTEEMSQRDEGFRDLVEEINGKWRTSMVGALRRAQAVGNLRDDVDPEGVALLIMAVRHGVLSQAKVARDMSIPGKCATTFFAYLDSLRPANSSPTEH